MAVCVSVCRKCSQESTCWSAGSILIADGAQPCVCWQTEGLAPQPRGWVTRASARKGWPRFVRTTKNLMKTHKNQGLQTFSSAFGTYYDNLQISIAHENDTT